MEQEKIITEPSQSFSFHESLGPNNWRTNLKQPIYYSTFFSIFFLHHCTTAFVHFYIKHDERKFLFYFYYTSFTDVKRRKSENETKLFHFPYKKTCKSFLSLVNFALTPHPSILLSSYDHLKKVVFCSQWIIFFK